MKSLLAKFTHPGTLLGALAVSLVLAVVVFAAISAQAATTAVITSAVHNEAHGVVTSASIGALVHDSVTVTGATTTNATGTVDFNRYPNTTCSGEVTVQSAVALVNGAAESASTTMPATGLSYKVHYSGQTDVYDPSDGVCEPVDAMSSSTSITTSLSTTTVLATGSFVHDSATLSGGTSDASGLVTYTVYSNNTCTLNALGAGAGVVTNGSVADSAALQFNTPGTYYWQAVYGGDAKNAAATSTCGDEVLTVIATSTPPAATSTGHIIVDKVTTSSSDPTSFHFTTTGSGYTSFDLTDTATPNDQTLNPGTYTVSEDAMTGWDLTSSLCLVNGAAANAYTPGSNLTLNSSDTITCTFTNTKQATTTPTTTPGTATIGGTVYNDLSRNFIRDAGEPGLAGWTINLFKGAGWWKHNNAPIMSATSDANGMYAFSNLADGTYSVEEVNQAGWTQLTGDYKSIKISGGSSKLDADFADATSTKTKHRGNGFLNRFHGFFQNLFHHSDNSNNNNNDGEQNDD